MDTIRFSSVKKLHFRSFTKGGYSVVQACELHSIYCKNFALMWDF